MEIEAWVKEKKELYTHILRFLELEVDSEDEFQALTKIIDDQEIVKSERLTNETFQLLYKIGSNHHRSSDLFNRLARIIQYLQKEDLPIQKEEIIKIFKGNKPLFLLLFECEILNSDESIVEYIMSDDQQELYYYNSIGIKEFIEEEFHESIETFISKMKEGSNDSYICKIIRQDSIEEFVSFINRTNLSLKSTIKADIYESNSFLIEKEASLIEYALFYGSIQVVKYLVNNHVGISPQNFNYAIHSNNPELIDFFEENKIEIIKENVMESIKCHHNDITNYIIDNLIDKSQLDEFYDDISQSIIDFCNYYYYPEDIISMISNPEKENFKMRYLLSSFNNIIIPLSVFSIGNNAFYGCSSLTQISIPSSVKSIGDSAFSKCSSLTQISIPSSVTSIGDDTFSGCSSLEQISIPPSVISIGNGAFYWCHSLTQITIPPSVISIGDSAFEGCLSLAQISIPSSVTSIGKNAFYKCISLKKYIESI